MHILPWNITISLSPRRRKKEGPVPSESILNARKGSQRWMRLTHRLCAACHSRVTAPHSRRKTMNNRRDEQTHVHHGPIFLRKERLCLSCIGNVMFLGRFCFVLFFSKSIGFPFECLSVCLSVSVYAASIHRWSIESFACPCRDPFTTMNDGTDTWLRPVIQRDRVIMLLLFKIRARW